MRQLEIDGRIINDENDCYFIAEIGHNHGGDLETCKQLFKAAKECDCDAVKLQKRDNKNLFTKAFYNKPYDNVNSYGPTYGEHREALEFGLDEYVELQKYAKELGITFFATAFDIVSADFLNELEMPAFKIASGDLTNTPLIKHIARFKKPVILSTGGATMEDIYRVYLSILHGDFAFLHCIASYPNQPEEMNLRIIPHIKAEITATIVGFSDHYNGIVMAGAAYIMGARIIEKHFTLDHSWKGTDHALSLQPDGMKRMIRDIKRLRLAMGDGEKRILPSEEKPIQKMGKSIHITKSISKDELITPDNIALKTPAGGLAPYAYDEVLGKIAVCDLSTGDELNWEVIK